MENGLVLVSGASGYLGSWVCKKLQEHGFRVRGTVRSLQNKGKVDFLYNLCSNPIYPIELVEADLMKPDSWTEAVKGCKFVVHTASPISIENPRDPDVLIKPAIEGTLSILRAAADAGTVEKVVITSSFAAIERSGRKEGNFTEEDWSVPENHTNIYCKSKTLAEKAAWDFVKTLPDKRFSLSTVVPVGIVGPALSVNPAKSIDSVVEIMEGKVPIIPQLYFNLVDVRDVATAHVKCLTNPEAANIRIITSNELLFFPDLARNLADEMAPYGYKIPTRVMPKMMMKFISLFNGELRAMRDLAEIPKPVSNERMKTVLGIEPISIKKSSIDMVHSLIELGRVQRTEQYSGPAAAS